jgi:hypothetical protein
MDCDKIAEIYLRSCGKQDDKGFIFYTWTEYYLQKIKNTNNDKVCLESMKLFDIVCKGKEDKINFYNKN